MAINESKMQTVIANYFKNECDVNTSIRQAFEKGFRIGVKKGASTNRPQEWILCSERLPSKKERVESYIRNERASEFIVMIKGANRPTTLYLSWDNYWFDENHDFYEVCAWMPLPEPYKEGE